MEERDNVIKRLLKNSILLSLLLHILFLLSISVVFVPKEKKYEPSPDHYVPSYVYKGTVAPPPRYRSGNHTPKKVMAKIQPPTQKPAETRFVPPLPATTVKNALPINVPKQAEPQKSIMEMSRDILHQNQIQQAMNRAKNEEPILLIGDKSKIVDPLILLMAKSLSAHFSYPNIEGNFGLTGRVIVELTLHPEGNFTDVQIIESSNNQAFDSAALYAVNTAPLVRGVDKFLSKPKSFVIGFIFG